MARFTYVEMICRLDQRHYDDQPPLENLVVEPVGKVNIEDLYGCYTAAFLQGDAQFYHLQDEAERRRYFDEELGFPEVLSNPASFAYWNDDELIGFALVMPYREANYHISCMCLLPAYQGLGLGKAMLNRIKNIALENGCRSLSLGTEPEMKAYQLYRNHGFSVTEEHVVDL